MDEHVKDDLNAAALNLAEAFSDWYKQANAPEQDLDVEEVAHAWKLLLFMEEKYDKLAEPVRQAKKDEGCTDCPDA